MAQTSNTRSSGILETQSSGDEIDFMEEHSLDDMPSTLSGRGALIGGLPISEGSRSQSEVSPPASSDLESALEPPDSDYAAYIPPLLFPTFSASRRSTPVSQAVPPTAQSSATEGPVQGSRANESSAWSESEPGWEEKFKKPSVWYSLACMSILMIGAIIALSVAITGKQARVDGMSPRQQEISRVLSVLLADETFSNAASPQARAYHWMLFEDTLWSNNEENFAVPRGRIVQRYSLAVLYYATNGPEDWLDDTWLTSTECGKLAGWNGIHCNDDGMVRVLTFDGNGLHGTLPAEIGHLTALENLVIQNDPKLSGSIPVNIGKLSLLRQLSLSENSLTGTIPNEIGDLVNLSYINLENNDLGGTIPPRVGELSQLRTLILSQNEIGGTVSFDILANTKMEYLALSSNKFVGEIDEFIRDMRFLKFLYLDRNAFSGNLPIALGEATSLQSINFDFNQIEGRIPAALGRLQKLEFISMQSNNFIGTLPGDLRRLTNLKTLNLVSCNLTGNLPDFSSMVKLNNLLLVGNNFFGTIAESLANLPSIEVAFLSSNTFSGTVPSFVSKSLKGLYLSENKLRGQIPDSICQNTKLEALFVDENQLSGTIPTCLGNLSDLKQLFLFKNQLTGIVPIELGRLRKLSGIGLEHNDLEGVVPGSVCAAAPADFWSDCGGVSPDLECPCCNVCCPSAECT